MNIDKKKLRKVIYIYMSAMAVIIFSSKTIHNLTLPKVTVAVPESGRLTKELEARGIISFSETLDIYAASSGQINEMLIKKGDIVSPDTIIATYGEGIAGTGADAAELAFGIERINNQLEALTAHKAAIQEKLRVLGVDPDDLYGYQCAVDDARSELDRQLNELNAVRQLAEAPFDDYEYQQAITDAERDWGRKQADAENMQVLLDEGAVALVEAISAQSAAEDAERTYARAVEELARAKEKASQESLHKVAEAESDVSDAKAALERAERNLARAGAALAAQAYGTRQSLDLELREVDLDIERARIDLRAAYASLEASSDDDLKKINAGCQGVVVSVEKSRGQFVSQGEKIATVGVDNNCFMSEISCMESDGAFIEIGDEASVSKSGSNTAIRAAVHDITPLGGTLVIGIVCETEAFSGGEYVNVRFLKQTPVYDAIVPNEAICREGMNNYVWIVRSRQGALGTEYYSVKTRVIIADSDDFHTAIARGLEMAVPVAPVVVWNDRDLTANGRVRRME